MKYYDCKSIVIIIFWCDRLCTYCTWKIWLKNKGELERVPNLKFLASHFCCVLLNEKHYCTSNYYWLKRPPFHFLTCDTKTGKVALHPHHQSVLVLPPYRSSHQKCSIKMVFLYRAHPATASVLKGTLMQIWKSPYMFVFI